MEDNYCRFLKGIAAECGALKAIMLQRIYDAEMNGEGVLHDGKYWVPGLSQLLAPFMSSDGDRALEDLYKCGALEVVWGKYAIWNTPFYRVTDAWKRKIQQCATAERPKPMTEEDIKEMRIDTRL